MKTLITYSIYTVQILIKLIPYCCIGTLPTRNPLGGAMFSEATRGYSAPELEL